MRVLLTADTVGGVWTYAVDLARGLAPRGVEIALATMGAPVSEHQQSQLRSLENVTLFESQFKLEWMNDPWVDVKRAGDWLLQIEQEFDADVVHLNGFAHGNLPFSAPKLVVGHSCVLSWWRACRGEDAPSDWNEYREQVTRGLADADLIAAPTYAMLDELHRLYGPLKKTRVISNGREPHRYSNPQEKEPFVLGAGRLWDEAKNLESLDAVAGRLPWPVYVAGDDQHPDGGRTSTVSASLLGKLDENALAIWYSRAAIFASPARYEPFGLSILEAALSGCALVLGDIPSLRENWDGAADFVEPDDTEQLHRSLCRLMETPRKRTALSNQALKRARRFSLEACRDAYFKTYESLVAASTSTSSRSTIACAS